MSERTDWDDTVDEAIEVLIDDSTDAFVLVGRQGEDTHLVEVSEDVGDRLLAIWVMVSRIMLAAEEAGESVGPDDVLAAAFEEAQSRGYLHPDAVEEYR